MSKEALERIAKEKKEKTGRLDLSYLNIGGSKFYKQVFSELNELKHLTQLYLISNKLQKIENLDNLSNLTQLFLISNQLQKIENLDKLSNLTTLDLSSNQLQKIENLDNLSNLTTLDLSSNQLQKIENLDNLSNLTKLYLSSNQLQKIENLDSLSNLTTLDLSSNQLQKIENLDNLSNLTELFLNDNQLQKIENLDNLSNLTSLDLSVNQLRKIENLDNLSNLTTLDLSVNQLRKIKNLDNLSKLTKLSLSSNQLQKIENLGNLSKLTKLSLSSNQLQKIENLDNLSNLTELVLSSNQLKKIENLDNLSNLIHLNLNDNQLQKFENLDNLSNLTKLYLISNQLQKIENLDNLSNLTELVLSSNQLKKIENLDNLSNLTELVLSSNQLKKIENLDNLSNLTRLDLSSNQLQKIESLNNLSNLTRLDLSDNQLQKIESLDNLSNLTSLDLSVNQLRKIENLDNLSNLIYLNLSDNSINNIITLKYFIKSGLDVKTEDDYLFNGIYIENCNITTPSLDKIKQGNEAILRFIKELESENKYPLREAKLIIIGAGGTGKTSMMVKLKNANNELPKSGDTTIGISVIQTPKEFTLNNDKYVMNIWDFGGQDIYHPAHQFFLTKNSVYILMQDSREKKTDFYYWLYVKELLADDSPLYIVQNLKDTSNSKVPLNDLQSKFSNIIKSFDINLKEVNKQNDEFKIIKKNIENAVQCLPHINELWPERRYKIRSAIIELKSENYITLKRFYSICTQYDYNDKVARKEFLEQLNFLGVIIHFNDEPKLNNLVITNPQWVTDAVYAIMNHTKNFIDKKGHFTWEDLEEVWKEDKYQGLFDKILLLMEKFELCFELNDEPNTYIAPLLLPSDKPIFDWNNEKNLQIEYHYDFLPKGIISRMIVRLHEDIEEHLYWKNGVVIQTNKTRGLIEEDKDLRKITIRTYGYFAKELLFKIYDNLDKINSKFHFKDKMNVTKLIPCNCRLCIDTENPHFFKYPIVLKRIFELKKETIECEVSAHDVNAKGLLEYISDKKLNIMKTKIFISYAHEDMDFCKELKSRVKPLLRTKKIESLWTDHEIIVGQKWDLKIKNKLQEADIVILLISPSFMASDYIYNEELPIIQKRFENKECKVFPILIRPDANWQDTVLSSLQTIPVDRNSGNLIPISRWEDQDDAWKVVVQEIKKHLS